MFNFYKSKSDDNLIQIGKEMSNCDNDIKNLDINNHLNDLKRTDLQQIKFLSIISIALNIIILTKNIYYKKK